MYNRFLLETIMNALLSQGKGIALELAQGMECVDNYVTEA